MILIPFSYQCGPTLFAYTVHAIENSYLVWTGAIASMSTYSHFLHTTFSAAGKTCFGSIVVLFAFIIIWCYFAFMPHYTISFLSLSLSLALSLRVALIGLNSIDVLAQAEKKRILLQKQKWSDRSMVLTDNQGVLPQTPLAPLPCFSTPNTPGVY